ncbi:conjugal transfer protein [Streptomyces fulvorobeus]|uniref:Conjugal transfer protein n=1 Tax=Streptomyces fulvorobeus TaxID=284028 RepID=A0A7Y9KZU2_9ACTN|nr:conjugal transfer protein [Streptomyces fulvorobeus]NYE44860.1 hypothetical protein [Streptomyces fulvorobeus]
MPEKPPALVRVGRIALWGAVGLLAAAGLRGLVAPPPSPAGPQAAPAPGPTAAAYPEDAARALAVRAAHAYLAWDEAKPEDRARELAAVLAAGVDPQLGWDGRGTQAVGLVVPGPVIPGRAGRARVRVDAQIAPGAGPVRWVAVEIPVAVAGGGRLVVSGPPALLGVPERQAPGPEHPERPVDPAFSAATRTTVTGFFRVWASGGAAQAAAPGTAVPALPEGVELGRVQSWEAAPGTGPDRTGRAHVVWAVGGGEITQAYRVQLTRVESARAARWQVAGISGDDLT